MDLLDTSRPTASNHEFPGSNDRKISVDAWYPADSTTPVDSRVDRADAPYPLIVLSHGLSSSKNMYVEYAQHLASHGYVVVAPDYPLSNIAAPGGPRLKDVIEQPKDVSFVIDKMLEFSDEEGNQFEGAIDPERIGATGHSLGAMTTFMSIYGPDRDDRIRAGLPFATPGCFFPDSFAGDVSVPVLFTTGTRDLITPPVSSDHVYDIANAPRYLATIKGADHVRFSEVDIPDSAIVSQGVLQNIGQGDFTSDAIAVGEMLGGGVAGCGLGREPGSDPLLDAGRQREILSILQTVFFDAYLREDDGALHFLTDGLSAALPEVSIESDLD